MLFSLAIIFIMGFFMADIFSRLKLPRIIGMIITGIIIGSYVLDLLDPSILGISSELRQIALIIILIKAGLSLNLSDLKKVGRPAVMMSFVPASFEIIGYVIFAPLLLGTTRLESAIMGAVMGTEKSIPQMILAGASCDDIFVIVLFSTFVTMAQGGKVNISDFLDIPVSIVSGIVIGIVAGLVLNIIFKFQKDTIIKTVLMISVAFLLMATESFLKKYIAVSGLIAVVVMSCVIKLKGHSEELSGKFGKLWIVAEVMLFVLVGAVVDISYTMTAGINTIIMIFVALMFRAVGVVICTAGTSLNIKERLFCVIAYLPAHLL